LAIVRNWSTSPDVPITPKVSVSGGSWVGEEDGVLEPGLLVGAVGSDEAEPDDELDDELDESQAASIPVPRSAAAARRVAPRVRLALARTAKP
jgi:hypothetical protein